jgi:hypothetical protein
MHFRWLLLHLLLLHFLWLLLELLLGLGLLDGLLLARLFDLRLLLGWLRLLLLGFVAVL